MLRLFRQVKFAEIGPLRRKASEDAEEQSRLDFWDVSPAHAAQASTSLSNWESLFF